RCVLPGSRGRDPAAVERRARGDPGDREVLASCRAQEARSSTSMVRNIGVVATGLALLGAPPPRVEVLRSTGALPAHIADAFLTPLAYQQTDAGQSFVFDRRAHAVYTIAGDRAKKVIEVGAEPGRVIDPTAFALDPSDGTFAIADAPLRKQRIQVFTANGSR